MSIHTEKAKQAGIAFYLANPNATPTQVDDASPVFNPCRRAFQEAFYFRKKEDALRLTMLVLRCERLREMKANGL